MDTNTVITLTIDIFYKDAYFHGDIILHEFLIIQLFNSYEFLIFLFYKIYETLINFITDYFMFMSISVKNWNLIKQSNMKT